MIAPTTTLLAYIPSPPQGVWNIGPFPLRAYALCIIVGIIVAVWWGNRRWIARGGQDGEVLDVAIWAVPFGLIGGRIYHLITDWRTYFGDGPKDPIDALKIWDGGLGIWGAVFFGALGAWIGARRHGVRLPAFGDAIAPPILLAQAIGRLGNYFNQELYGRETTVPWGLEIYERTDSAGHRDPGLISGVSNGDVVAVVHPTFLYELLWNVAVVVALVYIDRRFRIGHGRLFALYVAGYCVGRLGVELLRSDPATLIAGIRINVFTAAIVFACAAAYFVIAPRGREQGLEMYHPARAAELEEQGVAGYVDDWYDEDLDEPDESIEPTHELDSTLEDEVDDEPPAVDEAPAVDEPPADDEPPAVDLEKSTADGTADSADSTEPDADSPADLTDGTGSDAEGTADSGESTESDVEDTADSADGAADSTEDSESDAGDNTSDAEGTADLADSTSDSAESSESDAEGTPHSGDGAEPDDVDNTVESVEATAPDSEDTSSDDQVGPESRSAEAAIPEAGIAKGSDAQTAEGGSMDDEHKAASSEGDNT